MGATTIDLSRIEEVTEAEIAYFIGFTAGDGYIGKESRAERLKVEIQEPDRVLLEEMRQLLNLDRKIKLRESKLENSKNRVKLEVNQKGIIDAFRLHGIESPKAYSLKFPEQSIPKSLIRHYIRGFFDADGCIWFQRNNLRYAVSEFVSCSEQFMRSLHQALKEEGIESTLVKRQRSWRIKIHNAKNNYKLYSYLYKDSTIHLGRKKERFDNFCREKGLEEVR